jgi:uncharacterized membrane protein
MVLRRRAPLLAVLLLLPTLASAAAPKAAANGTRHSLMQRVVVRPVRALTMPIIRGIHVHTFTDRMTDGIAASTGSLRYVSLVGLGMLVWMAWNASTGHPVDPAPFIGLNTFISISTWAQQGFLQMSQNRQAKLDAAREEQVRQVSVRAEEEIRELQASSKERFDTMELKIDQLTRLNEQLLAERGGKKRIAWHRRRAAAL